MSDFSKQLHELLELAVEEFGELSASAHILFQSVCDGKIADFIREEIELRNGENSGDSVPLKAEYLRWLCANPVAREYVTHGGIAIRGGRITGDLDLEYVEIPFPFWLEDCIFDGTIYLNNAEIGALYFYRTRTSSIIAYGLRVKGDVWFCKNSNAQGKVNLDNSTIGGNLKFDGGRFCSAGDGVISLSARSVKVEGSVFMNSGFELIGQADFRSAEIGGNLECANGSFRNDIAEESTAEAERLREKRKAIEKLIREALVREESQEKISKLRESQNAFADEERELSDKAIALNATGIRIGGGVFLNDDFRAVGEVRLREARIGGNLHCIKGSFLNEKGVALGADRIRVDGSVFMYRGFDARGRVEFISARIEHYLIWRRIEKAALLKLNLQSARIGTLSDDQDSWPPGGHLVLSGLEYDAISRDTFTGANTHVDWLNRQYSNTSGKSDVEGFSAQPYEQLAKILRKNGYEDQATDILIEKAKQVARRTQLSMRRRLLHCVLGWTIGYGYRPARALLFALAIVVFGMFFFHSGYEEGLMNKAKDSVQYPEFNALVYSLDVFVPVVNLHQASYWIPDSATGAPMLANLSWTTSGTVLRGWFWFQILAGWTLTTLLVAALAGLIRG